MNRRKYPGWVLWDEKWQKVRAGTKVKISLMPDLWPRLKEAADRHGWHLYNAVEIREGDLAWAEVLCDGAGISSLEALADVVMSLGGTARLVQELATDTPRADRLRKTDRVRVVADIPRREYFFFALRCMDHGIGISREQLRDGDTSLYTLELDARTEGQVDRCIDLAAMYQGRCRVTPVYERPGAAE